MRGGRMLLIVGAILIIGALLAVGAYMLTHRTPPPTPEAPSGETPVAETPPVQIVIAAQNIPQGTKITEEMATGEAPAVVQRNWQEELPEGAITRIEDVYNRTTRVDIVVGMPILASLLVEPGAALTPQIPDGMVAYALPVARYSSVAWALQPGDYVDMIVSLLLVDLDEEFQSTPPLNAACVSVSEGEECKEGAYGRLEVLPNGLLVNLTPSEAQRPRLVTQLTIQKALVLRVGDWPRVEEEAPVVEEAGAEATPSPEVEAGVAPEPTPAPVIEPLTLAVTRQDAMVLDYAQLTDAHITFVLRKAGDEENVTTSSVTLQYLMEHFNIEMPAKLPYGVEPRVSRVPAIGAYETTEQASSAASQPQQ